VEVVAETVEVSLQMNVNVKCLCCMKQCKYLEYIKVTDVTTNLHLTAIFQVNVCWFSSSTQREPSEISGTGFYVMGAGLPTLPIFVEASGI